MPTRGGTQRPGPPGQSRPPSLVWSRCGGGGVLSGVLIENQIDSHPSTAYSLRSRAYVIRRRERPYPAPVRSLADMTDELAIEAIGLEKSYGAARVLARVDLRVARGSVFSLLGPNGAGKTTMVRILSTLTRPDAGQARVAGFDILGDRHRVRRSIRLTRSEEPT